MSRTVNENDKIQGAGMGRRIGALLLDYLILSVISFVWVLAVILITGPEEMMTAIFYPDFGKVYFPYRLMYIGVAVIEFLYYVFQESSKYEATLGKRVAKLQVVCKNGQKARVLDIVVRSIMRVLPMLLAYIFITNIGFFIFSFIEFLTYFVVLFNKDHRALHDFVAGTVVSKKEDVQQKRSAQAMPEINIKLPSPEEIKASAMSGSDYDKTTAPVGKGQKILCISGMYKGAELPLDAPIIMGRDSRACNLIFENDTKGVSKVHCRIEMTAIGVTIVDMGSTYGTTVNGKKITAGEKVRLNVGERFRIGKAEEFIVQ